MRRIYHPRISDSEGTLPVIHGGLGSRDIDKAAQNIGLVTYRLANKPFGIILYNAQKRINKDSLPPEISDPSVPSLYGNREVEVGQTLILKITNYDSFTIYSVFATNGVAIQRGEELHYTAGAVSGPGSITINGRTFSVTIKSPRPLTPSVVVPSEDSQLTNTTATFEATAFNITGNYDTHASTDWEVSTDPQFNTLIAAIYETPVHKSTWTVNNMQELKKHYVRVRYRGQQRGVSDWSPVREFTTGNDGLLNTETSIIEIPRNNTSNTSGFNKICAVSEDDQYMVIADMYDGGQAPDAGCVYFYKRVNGSWQFVSRIVASDGAINRHFGSSVSLSSDGLSLAVGAYFYPEGKGAVYFYTRSGDVWTQRQKIQPGTGQIGDTFGQYIELSSDGNTLAVSSYGYDIYSGQTVVARSTGTTYIYSRSGNTWSLQTQILPNPYNNNSCFGYNVALSEDGNHLVLSEIYDDTKGLDAGAAHYYNRSGTTWTFRQKITASDGVAGDNLGIFVSMNAAGDTLVLSSTYNDGKATDAGAAYVFTRSGNVWTQQQKILPYDGIANDYFGTTCFMSKSSNLLFISSHNNAEGANKGSIYVYRRSGNTYNFERKLRSSVDSRQFGYQMMYFSESEKLLIAGSIKPTGYDYYIHTFE